MDQGEVGPKALGTKLKEPLTLRTMQVTLIKRGQTEAPQLSRDRGP